MRLLTSFARMRLCLYNVLADACVDGSKSLSISGLHVSDPETSAFFVTLSEQWDSACWCQIGHFRAGTCCSGGLNIVEDTVRALLNLLEGAKL